MNDLSLPLDGDSCFLKFCVLLFGCEQQSRLNSKKVIPEVWANKDVCRGGHMHHVDKSIYLDAHLATSSLMWEELRIPPNQFFHW